MSHTMSQRKQQHLLTNHMEGTLKKFLAELISLGWKVLVPVHHSGDYAYISPPSGKGVGWVKSDKWGSCLGAVHHPHPRIGTGYREFDDEELTEKRALHVVEMICPQWAYKDAALIKKYADFDDFIGARPPCEYYDIVND